MSAAVLFFTGGLLAGVLASFLASRWLVHYSSTRGERAYRRGVRINAWEEISRMIDTQADWYSGTGNKQWATELARYASWAREQGARVRLEAADDESAGDEQ